MRNFVHDIMIGKKSRLYSILTNKCPSCHEGKYFVHGFSFLPSRFSKARELCDVCSHKFEKEPGFFFGAMFVSYGLAVALGVGTFLLIYLIRPQSNYVPYIIFIPLAQILLSPLNFRLSRLIWMNMFTGYKDKTPSIK